MNLEKKTCYKKVFPVGGHMIHRLWEILSKSNKNYVHLSYTKEFHILSAITLNNYVLQIL